MPLQTAYRALSDATRREILWLVRDTPRTLRELALALDLSTGPVARHLGLLVAAGLVRRDGDVYTLKTSVLADVVHELAELAALGPDASRPDLVEPRT
ncbi:MAG TPA: ArsR family transcriptional regulator [Iamia sp.]|nr:ArsR family transcriptional regulator [Iamia sp.]